MGLIAKDKGGSKFPPVEPGLYKAICYGVVDLGTHFNERFGNTRHEVVILWELPDAQIEVEDENGQKVKKPRAISKRYTLSLNQKANLRKDLESWRGKAFTKEELDGFDLKNLINAPCQLQININDNGYNVISAIVQLPKGSERPIRFNPVQYFSFEDFNGEALPAELPDWIKDEIQASDEYQRIIAKANKPASAAEPVPTATDDDGQELPF